MYNGNENLINDGKYLPYSMLNFWQWAYSNILQNMQRGTFAEYIVRCALKEHGLHENLGMKMGVAPYDLDGPVIPSTGKKARLEVKSAALVQLWDIHHPERSTFTIRPAVMPDPTGDYPDGAPKQRNNDIYIFTVYTATDRRRNMLDLSWWEFYVLPTFKIEADAVLRKQQTISLKAVKEWCPALSFDMLYDAIVEACNIIPAHFDRYTIRPDNNNGGKNKQSQT